MIIGHAMRLALAGIVAGLAAAYGLTRLMATMLYDVKPTDPLVFGSVALLLGLVAFLASYLPARRAVRIEPVLALRCE
jgi:ABC-type antimicrobial peptide transport system permease subunit